VDQFWAKNKWETIGAYSAPNVVDARKEALMFLHGIEIAA